MEGRDYSRPGWYFVTMCADYHKHLFGSILGVEMIPNALGNLVEQCWKEIPKHYEHIELVEQQLMPNHFHGILHIRRAGGAALGEVLNMFKGNKELLKTTPRGALRVSRKASEAEILKLKTELPNYDGVVCSTFFSPGERECLKTLLAGTSRIIWFLPMAMPEKIPVAWTDAFLQQRALWLSAFDEQKATRANCMRANDWVERFCIDGSRHGEKEH